MTIAKPSTPTLIDTISEGYTALNRKIWVLIIPIALNLYLWLGTRLSLAPFLGLIRDKLSVVASFLTADPLQQEQLVVYMQNADMRMPLAWLNFVPVLPTAMLHNGTHTSSNVFYVREMIEVFGSVVGINLLLLLVSSLFLMILTMGVVGESCRLGTFLKRLFRSSVCIVAMLLIVIGTIAFFVLPLVVMIALVLTRVPPIVVQVSFLLGFVLWFWVYLYTGFAIEAIVLAGDGPVKALRNSIKVVQRNMFGTFGLIVLSAIIANGLGIIWRFVAFNSIGLVVAIAGSAYIGSGLAAARLSFYHERFMRLAHAE